MDDIERLEQIAFGAQGHKIKTRKDIDRDKWIAQNGGMSAMWRQFEAQHNATFKPKSGRKGIRRLPSAAPEGTHG
jgi:hypothetical protein